MRITIVLPGLSYAPVGGYKVVYQYANYLKCRGHEVTIVHGHRPEGAPSMALDWNGRAKGLLVRLNKRGRPRWFGLEPGVAVQNFWTVSPDDLPPSDVLVATAARTAPIVAAAAERQRRPGAYFIQHYEDWSDPSEFVDSTWRLPLTRLVIAGWLQQKGRELGVESTLVPNAIDTEEFPAGGPVDARPFQISAMVSKLAWKRTDLVAEVFKRLVSEWPGVRLVAFGTCPRPDILPDRVTYQRKPTRAELRAIYQSSRVYLCASDTEGWHLPPAEALSSGAAVVSTDIPGVREYAEGAALFAAPGDAESLTLNCLRLLRDVQLCSSLASNGRRRMEGYTPRDAAARFETELVRIARESA